MVAVIKTYSIDNKELPIIDELNKILGREGKKRGLSEWILKQMKEYVKVHANGNPIYTIDKYVDPNFKPFPAFKESLTSTWIPYFQIQNDESLKEIIKQAHLISIHAMAYLSNTNRDLRRKLNFADLRTVAKAGEMINPLNP